jgi:hypothetical protein
MSRLLSDRSLWRRLFRFGSRPDRRARPAREVLIVRRGMSDAYYFYLQKFAVANEVALVQDRRVDDRRHWLLNVPANRRNTDRRAPPPTTWAKGDVVVIRPQDKATDLNF